MEINVKKEENTTVITLEGSINTNTAPAAIEVFKKEASETDSITLDMSGGQLHIERRRPGPSYSLCADVPEKRHHEAHGNYGICEVCPGYDRSFGRHQPFTLRNAIH